MKQLDIEYKNAISLELPDLWSRIEAGVDEFEASKKANEPATKETITATNQTPVDINEVRKSKQNRQKTLRYIKNISAAAASILVLVVVVKAFSLKGSSSATAPMESPAADTADFAASDAAAEATAEETYEEAAAEEDNASYEEAAEATKDEHEAMDEAAEAEGVGDSLSAASEATSEDRSDEKKVAPTNNASYLADDVTNMETLAGFWGLDEAAAAKIEEILVSEAGIKEPAEYSYITKDMARSSLPYGVKSGMSYVRVSLKDASTEEEYILTLVRTGENDPTLLNVVKASYPFDVVYEAEEENSP